MDYWNSRNNKSEMFNCEDSMTKYKCSYCNFTTDLRITLNDHISKHHKSGQNDRRTGFAIKSYPCKSCNFTSYSLIFLYLHQPKCSHIFADVDVRHTNKWFECDQCDYRAKYNKYLKYHVIVRHTDPKDIEWFECYYCGFKTKLKGTLKMHINVKHFRQSLKHYECNQCSYKTVYKQCVKTHMITHQKNPDEIEWFKCDHCDFRTKYKISLSNHMAVRHTDPKERTDLKDIKWFECYHCGFKTKFKGALKGHISVKHASENLKQYECNQCSFKTVYKNGVKKHMVTHQNNPDEIEWFKCNHCDYRVKKYKRNLNRHVAIKHKTLL